MSAFNETLDQSRRLYLLQLLAEAGGSANESILRQACRAGFHAHGMTRQRIRDDLAWLEDRGCVRRTWLEGDVLLIASLTDRGEDASRGDVRVPGVQRPPLVAR